MTKTQITLLLVLIMTILILAGPQESTGFLLDGQKLR